MRIVCPKCGSEVPGGMLRSSELSWCSSKCARLYGAPDPVLRALMEIEAQAAGKT